MCTLTKITRAPKDTWIFLKRIPSPSHSVWSAYQFSFPARGRKVENWVSEIVFFCWWDKLMIGILRLFFFVRQCLMKWIIEKRKIGRFLFLSVPLVVWEEGHALSSRISQRLIGCLLRQISSFRTFRPPLWLFCVPPRAQQFIQTGEGELYCLMNFTGTVGIISICAKAASASDSEACNALPMLMTVTLSSLDTEQIQANTADN